MKVFQSIYVPSANIRVDVFGSTVIPVRADHIFVWQKVKGEGHPIRIDLIISIALNAKRMPEHFCKILILK